MVTEANRKRTARLGWILFAVWGTLAGSAGWMTYAAQRVPVRSLSAHGGPQLTVQTVGYEKPLRPGQTPQLDMRRINPHLMSSSNVGVVSGPNVGASARIQPLATSGIQPANSPPPYFDLTTFPRPPAVGDGTASHDLHPTYSTDQASIFFESDRPLTNPDGTTIGTTYHIWQMTPDGNSLIAATGTRAGEATGDQIMPALSHSRTLLAWAGRGSGGGSFQIFTLNRNTNLVTQLTGLANQKDQLGNPVVFVNVGRPAWSAGDNLIAFSAQNAAVANDRNNIWTIDLTTKTIRNVTKIAAGSSFEAVDAAWRRISNEDRLAFASQATSAAVTNVLANPTAGFYHIWEARFTGANTQEYRQLTNFANASDREPNWNQSAASLRNGSLTFESKGRPIGPKPVSTSFNIYWIPQTQGPTLATPTRETGATLVNALPTPDTDPTSATFDTTDETAPSWSMGLNGVERIAHHANRIQQRDFSVNPPVVRYVPSLGNVLVPGNPTGDVGTGSNRDVWTADIADVNPPTLLPVDDTKGQILRVTNQRDPSLGQNGIQTDTFKIETRISDIASGVNNVWAQIKDPDSSFQDAQGQEHKLYSWMGPQTQLRTTLNATTYLTGDIPGRVTGDPRLSQGLIENIEFDCEGVRADSGALPVFYSRPQRPDGYYQTGAVASAVGIGHDSTQFFSAQLASYDPGGDDAFAWTGLLFPPLNDGRWLQMFDDGPGGGHGDLVAGDGIYTNLWQTPDVASDYYIDIIAYDKAVDPTNPANQQNWIIYDNMGGLSTQPLVPQRQCLAVMDHALGQKWLRGLKGAFRAFPGWRFGTESEILDRTEFDTRPKPNFLNPNGTIGVAPDPPTNQQPNPPFGPPFSLAMRQNLYYDPANPCNPAPNFAILNVPIVDFTTAPPSGGQFATSLNFVGGPQAITTVPVLPSSPQALINCQNPSKTGNLYPLYGADIWRILAKGPVPPEVLSAYLPTVEFQPKDVSDTQPYDVPRLISQRCVLWHAPFTGDIFTGGGTILDPVTQQNLTDFTNHAGRLIVDGGDIAWALTSDTPNPNSTAQPFVRDVLDAVYLGDNIGAQTAAAGNLADGSLCEELVDDIYGRQGDGGFKNNRSGERTCPFGMNQQRPDTLYTPFIFPPGNSGMTSDLDDGQPSSEVGTGFGILDGIAPLPGGKGSQVIYDQRMIAREDPVPASPDPVQQLMRAKVVYCGFGLHSFGRHVITSGSPDCAPASPPTHNPANYIGTLVTLNYKSKVGHNIMCWMFTASIQGQVIDISNQPVSGALVQAFWTDSNNNSIEVGSALTDVDGHYLINGLPHGNWGLRVTSPGYVTFNKPIGGTGHALTLATSDIRMTPAVPGGMTGTVRDTLGNTIAGAHVLATLQAGPLFRGTTEFRAVTGANGTYQMQGMPAGDYVVIIEQPYPPNFGDPVTSVLPMPVTVLPGQTLSGVDFTMTGQPAPLTIRAFETVNGIRNGNRVANAQVTLTPPSGPPIIGTTNVNGDFNAGLVPPGTIAYTVTQPQHLTVSGTFAMPQTSPLFEVDMEVDNRPTFDVIGRVIFGPGGVLLTSADNLTVRAEQNASLQGSTPVIDPTGIPPHNFQFVGVNQLKQGTYDFVVNSAKYGNGQASNVDVNGNQGTIDIILPGLPGRLSGFVKQQANGQPIQNASVQITSQSDPNFVPINLTTSSTGAYQTPGTVPAGVYTVRATHPLFVANQVSGVLVSGDTQAPDILLGTSPPTQIRGTIRSSVSPQPLVGGMLVELFEADGVTPVAGVSTVSAAALFGSPPANYQLDNVPVGRSYVVRVSGAGFRSAQQATPIITSAGPLNGLNFLLDPQFTFTPGLWLVSPPATYGGSSAQVFGNPPGFNAAKWLPVPTGGVDGQWLDVGGVYPPRTVPLAGYDPNQVIAGYGQFVRITTNLAFTAQGGVTPPRNQPYGVPVLAGWSLVGSGRDVRINISDIQVQRANNEVLTWAEAISRGIVLNDVVGWSGSTYVHNQVFMETFRGYFVKTNEAVTLLMPPTSQTAMAQPAARYAGLPFSQRRQGEAERARSAPAPSVVKAASREERGAPARSWLVRLSRALLPGNWPWERAAEPALAPARSAALNAPRLRQSRRA